MAPDLDLRQLRYFVAVAEELNFTRAAERLHIAQQALSSQVQRLEQRLGVQLLIRDTHHTELTPAGRTLLEEGRRAIDQAARAADLTVLAAEGKAGTLRVAFKAHMTAHFAPALVANMRARLPGIRLDLVAAYTLGEELELLRARDVDAIFAWLPLGDDELAAETIREEPRVVALPPSHPLAKRTSIDVEELADDPVVAPHTTLPPAVLHHWLAEPRPGGRPALRGPEARTAEECLLRVAEGDAVWIVPESVSGYFAYPEVAWVPLTGVEPARVAVAWRAGEPSPLVRTLVAEARRAMAAAPAEAAPSVA